MAFTPTKKVDKESFIKAGSGSGPRHPDPTKKVWIRIRNTAPGKNLNAAPALTLQSLLRIRSDPDTDVWDRIRTSGTGYGRLGPDTDVWDRIRILALRNYPILTFLVCVKAINTSGISV
jgi:hypothetical protein